MATPGVAHGRSATSRGCPRTWPTARTPRANNRPSASAPSGFSRPRGRRSTSAMRHTCPGISAGRPPCAPGGACHDTWMREGMPGGAGSAGSATNRCPPASPSGSSAMRSTSRDTASWCASASPSSSRHCACAPALSSPAHIPSARAAPAFASRWRKRINAASASRHAPASSQAAPAPGRRGASCTAPEPATNAMQKMRPVINASRNGRA
ncbi:hypothetical protein LMG1860_04291 [Achromobacter denitrificans]|nr:hypothetical protein LMG1860_04291 [Achromobacter denitrificans]